MSNKSKYKRKQSYSNKYNKSKVVRSEERTNIWLLLPIIIVMSVLPFITRLKQTTTDLFNYPWYQGSNATTDFFLYNKQVLFLIIVAYMACIVIYKAYKEKTNLLYSPILIPLGVYAALSLLSSIFTKYRSFSFKGTPDHYESVFVLLGYCLIVYYIMLFVDNEKDLDLIINYFIVSIILMSILGLTQFTGNDFFSTDIGKKFILPSEYWDYRDGLEFNFANNRVYLTLHNPNYVGSYVALTAPFLLVMSLLIRKKVWRLPIYLLALVGVLISLIGSNSKTAIIGLILAGVLILVLLSRYLIKYFYISIPIFLFIIGSILTYNHANDNILIKQLRPALNFVKTEPSLQDIQTLDDKLIIKYNDNELQIRSYIDSGHQLFTVVDSNGNELSLQYSEDKGGLIIPDERFSNFILGNIYFQENLCFYVRIDGHDWYFTNNTDDGTYYYINRYGRMDKIKEAPSSLFTGYEEYASGRGYIWSRSLPLLKKHLILGSGADTYTLAFPQDDYVNLYNYGYSDQLLTKPHNLYLQTGVQTGVISLIAYLVFYGMYFVSSFKLYIKGRFKSYYSQIGVAILASTFAYMVVSIANDSLIAVAPIFWAFVGLGIVVNRKAKPLIEEEIATEREMKDASRAKLQ